MSNIFLKNKKVNGNVSEFLDTESVSTASLPQWLSVVDVPQKGGNDHEASPSSTTTAALEDKLREIFATPTQAQAGGKRMKKSKKVDVTEDGAAKKPSKKASKKSSKKAKRVKKASKKTSKKASKKTSKKSSKKASKKSSKKASKKGSKKMTGGKKASKKGSKKMTGVKKASKKSSKKGSKAKRVKKASKKSSKKTSKKSSKKTSKKGSKKAKRSAPAHAALMVEVIKMIVVKDSINYPAAMKKLGTYIAKAIGKPYEKGGDITYIDALKKTKTMLNK